MSLIEGLYIPHIEALKQTPSSPPAVSFNLGFRGLGFKGGIPESPTLHRERNSIGVAVRGELGGSCRRSHSPKA